MCVIEFWKAERPLVTNDMAPCEEFAAEEKLNNAEVEKEEENEFLCEKKKKNYSFRKSAICMQHLLLLFLTFLRVHEYIYIYTYPN